MGAKNQPVTHEVLLSTTAPPSTPDREFGWVFTGFFALVGLWPIVHGRPMRLWCLGVSVVLALITLVKADLLHPFNLVWMKFSALLSKIMNPIVLGLAFVVIFIPSRLLLWLTNNDPLKRRWEPETGSYWITREHPGPAPESMRHQY